MSTHTKTASATKAEATPARTPTPVPRFSSSRSVLLQRKCACGGGGTGCETCQQKQAEEQKKTQEQRLQKSASGPGRSRTAPPVVNQVLNSPGRPLEAPTRSYMEPRFGRDFGGVRVHTDSRAAESARAVDAHAYTVGQHIVFDHGKYDPGSRSGQHLLAHELAHTVQQHGLQRSSDNLSLGQGGEYRRLEHEADSIARSVTSGSSGRAMPPITNHPSQPTISRAKKDNSTTAASEPPVSEGEGKHDWQPVKPGGELEGAGVQEVDLPGAGVSKDIVAVHMKEPFSIPKEKGRKPFVEDVWNARASEGGLEVVINVHTGEPKVGLKQATPSSDQKRAQWLQRVRWDPAPKKAGANWLKAGGDTASFDPPQVNKITCDVDHILELQFGGNNVPENMQMLDRGQNRSSGSTINHRLKDKTHAIVDALKKEMPGGSKAKALLLHYDHAVQEGELCLLPKSCCTVDAAAEGIHDYEEGKSSSGAKAYPIKAGGFKAILVPQHPSDQTLDIERSDIAENKSAKTIIPGLVLKTWDRGGKSGGVITAAVDTGSRLPVTIDAQKEAKQGSVKLNRGSDADGGPLTLASNHPNLAFTFAPLSPGVFKTLKLEEDGSLSGVGTIRPTVSFLPELDIEFTKDSFKLSKDILPKDLKQPFPGARITKAAIAMELAPQFKPSGTLEFEVKPGAKKLLEGKVEVTTDGKGLIATGELRGFLPGVDDATGKVSYQDEQWSGEVNIATSQLSKLKYLKSGSAKLGVTGKHITASGQVDLDVPHTNGISVSLGYAKEQFLFKGKGTFNPPRLKPVDIHVEYDGEHISGSAETEFEFHSLSGRIKIQYHDNKFSGEGDLEIKKGKATGSLHVIMEAAGEHPTFSGEGHVSYEISPSLIASAGIEIDKNEKVRFKGALEFPKPIPLFPPKGDDYKIFGVDVKIPIPGLSIPKVGGINAKIKGGLYAGYHIGPGELRHLKAEVTFSPLEDKPDLDITLSGQFYIGMDAHITGTISGGVEVDILVASVSGGLGIAATAALKGESTSDVKVHYQEGKLDAQADFKVLLDLVLSLVVCAWVHAEAGFWRLKVETTKVWKLKAFRYDSGLKLGMTLKKPIRYISGEGFQFPSVSDIDWIKPDVDPQDLLGRLFGAQDPSPNEDVDGEKECGQ